MSPVAMLTVVMLLPALARGEAWQWEPEVSVGGGYDTNVRLTSVDEQAVGSGRVAGALKFSRLTESFELTGLARLDYVFYSGDTQGISNSGNQLFGFISKKKWERTDLGIDALWKRDTIIRSVRVIENPDNVQIEPDQSVDDDIVREDIRRNRVSVRVPLNYKLSDRNRVGLIYNFNAAFYEDQGKGVDLNDYTRNTLGLKFNRDLTEKDKGILVFRASLFDSESDRKTNNYEIQAGLNHSFSETLTAGFTLGGRYTEFDDPGTADDGNDTGFVARLRASKLAGNARYDIVLFRNLSPSGVGQLVQTDSLNANMTYAFNEHWSFSFRSRLFENDAIDNPTSRNNRRYLSLVPVLTYQWTENLRVEGFYRYLRQKRFADPQSADSNAVFLNLRWSKISPLDVL